MNAEAQERFSGGGGGDAGGTLICTALGAAAPLQGDSFNHSFRHSVSQSITSFIRSIHFHFLFLSIPIYSYPTHPLHSTPPHRIPVQPSPAQSNTVHCIPLSSLDLSIQTFILRPREIRPVLLAIDERNQKDCLHWWIDFHLRRLICTPHTHTHPCARAYSHSAWVF